MSFLCCMPMAPLSKIKCLWECRLISGPEMSLLSTAGIIHRIKGVRTSEPREGGESSIEPDEHFKGSRPRCPRVWGR